MPYTDRHGRPEILMHPNIARGVASYRRETPVDQTARDDDRWLPPAEQHADEPDRFARVGRRDHQRVGDAARTL